MNDDPDRHAHDRMRRAFLAVELSAAVKATVGDWMAALARRIGPSHADGIRWTREANLHVTLHFFGGLSSAQVEAVSTALRPAWPIAAFELRVAGSGTFPPQGAPRVVWAGVRDAEDALARIHAEVERRLRPIGFAQPEEGRPFAPHLTLGRVRRDIPRSLGRDLRAWLADSDFGPAACHIGHLTLFESRLSPRGPTYAPIETFPL